MRAGCGRGRVVGCNPATQEVLQCRGPALVRNVNGVDAGAGIEQFSGQVRGRPSPGRGKVQATRFFLRQRHIFSQRIDTDACMDHQYIGKVHTHCDGCEVAYRVIAQLHEVRRDG